MKKASLLCGVLVFMLAGCGQKGPLYLPQSAKPSPDTSKTVPATSASSESKQASSSGSTGGY